MRSDSLGVTLETGAGRIELLSPVAVRGIFGETIGTDPKPHFVATRIVVASLNQARALLEANGVRYRELHGSIVVPARSACGVTIALTEGQCG